MMPNTSVSPAAMRKSMTPYCRPFNSCSKTKPQAMAKKRARLAPFPVIASLLPFHLAVLVVGVLVLLERLGDDLHLGAVLAALDRLQQVEVLDRVLVDVELEFAAHGAVVRLAHFLHQRLRILQVALGAAHR